MHLHRRYYGGSYSSYGYDWTSERRRKFGIVLGSIFGGAVVIGLCIWAIVSYREEKKKKVPRTQTVPTPTQQTRDIPRQPNRDIPRQQPRYNAIITPPNPPAVPGYFEPTAPPPTYKDSRNDRAYMDPAPGNDVILVDSERAMVRAPV
ncbi:hypothetical protein C7M61_002617 [Candidozyma pseudohaemuli]|uniref:Uncharacterized protein n=1 Tax=Candidozyma pseudohaemuli TaxID=418784 RepID=A0A2P7YRT3_9ASCO|nr:hypothetical protein C7M61_002617 [[Candida] pseudohaemulonii]PSK38680.1 hypothetical protein C7M61_002617 [[Candida] pseudohaemulonii]